MSELARLLEAPDSSIDADNDLEQINRLCYERGWTDGLPIVPPTEQRVEQMLAYCDRPWSEPLAKIPPRYGDATPLRIAANAVMAGCEPRYFPLIVLAIEAMCEPPFNLYGVQATTHPCAPLMIVNGPVAREVGINCGHNALGPGAHANATIGRAIRLVLLNIGGAIPGVGDMCTYGSPAKYTYCVAENEAASPWEPLHVERGFPIEASTVTMVAAECPHNVNDHESTTAEGILTTFAGTMATTGTNDPGFDAQPVALFGPEHAKTVAAGGYSKAAAKRYLQQHSQVPLGKFSKENVDRRFRIRFKEEYGTAGPDALLPVLRRAEDLIIVVIGGAGKHSAFLPTYGSPKSVTRALRTQDGRFAQSVEEFRR